uniref:CARD domain-containing protein n=1 Tax=Acanthochromis polyacanthus TaxID=80966 RepID=A0A3Q1GAX2_9TELE
ELQNLSVILENLYQKGVLSDEEVRNIQAERDGYDKTRKILDSVMKKGEAACYEFLRIIHVTRKRTLGRPTPLSEKNTGASTGIPQLWKTSCVVPVPKISHPKDLNHFRPT